jgi:hypothetical protein
MVTREVGYGLLAALAAVGVLVEVRAFCVRCAHGEI